MLQLVRTADGSNTLFNPLVGENYHSRNGALQESIHVFLKSGLEYFLTGNNVKNASILEVGFGTGLNFLVTADYCRQHEIHLSYTGIEAYPIDKELLDKTGYSEYVSAETWKSYYNLYSDALKSTISLNLNTNLHIAHTLLKDFNTDQQFDVLYFDAFASVHQPEMWTDEALAHVCQFLKPGGVFVTYAITGNLKRSMKALGFKNEKAPGAPGKREMLRSIKI
jgi:tRNA U34 5-methylaminomethyl-2-thiouridine-forming methyltransferase MnmC